jgi:1-acyl-sn-glycerol-3-phosphate acyltransferase
MLYFILAYLWCWVIVPFTFVILRPFVRLDYQLNARHFIYNVLGVQHKITGEKLIDEGFILGNHRSFMDAMFDVYIGETVTLCRGLVILGAPFIVLLSYIDNRVILINRDKDKRNGVYQRCILHINQHQTKRVMFYPEGTRNNYTSLSSCEELKSYIKFGLLKTIYEDKRYPVQLLISNNKELAFNEKKLFAKYGVKIHTKISKAIHPKDYATEVEFFDDIVNIWFDCYVETHSHDLYVNY